ncbi:CLUMA_CG014809, isoform A [Clunio marinus]|uniref:CLUMA_CG014809, isoform A n=1 Tax=Clunio marinus TaxID=568069 RepID=A0A1J1IL56_9DIPT|nr:CLUMA_CG014809, isoform A [Clunio marinus]
MSDESHQYSVVGYWSRIEQVVKSNETNNEKLLSSCFCFLEVPGYLLVPLSKSDFISSTIKIQEIIHYI